MEWYVGEIRLFAFSRIPLNWIACNGQGLPIAEYAALYSLIGTRYGGDGLQFFNLPDLRGRVPLSFGQQPGKSLYSLGQRGGNEQVTLITSQIPPHDHGLMSSTAPSRTATPGLTVHLGTITPNTKTLYAPKPAITGYDEMAPTSIANTGDGASHNNMMPSLVMNFCIATEGVYPSGS